MLKDQNDYAFVMLYSPFPDEATAHKAATALIEKHLAACVNVIPGVSSFYRWEGKVTQSTEFILMAKTRSEKTLLAQKMILRYHPDECPAIVHLPIVAGHEPYLDWLIKETL